MRVLVSSFIFLYFTVLISIFANPNSTNLSLLHCFVSLLCDTLCTFYDFLFSLFIWLVSSLSSSNNSLSCVMLHVFFERMLDFTKLSLTLKCTYSFGTFHVPLFLLSFLFPSLVIYHTRSCSFCLHSLASIFNMILYFCDFLFYLAGTLLRSNKWLVASATWWSIILMILFFVASYSFNVNSTIITTDASLGVIIDFNRMEF